MRRRSATTVYLFLVGSTGFFFWTWAALSALYRIQKVGLNPLQLVLVGTVLELTVFAFEIPTGVVADTISRRLSVIVGVAIVGVGFIIEGLFPVFAVVVVAHLIWGVGHTFTSGATEAWLADELQDDERTTLTLLRATQVRQVAALFAIGAAVVLASVDLGLPLVVGGAGHLLVAAVLMVVMPETGFARTASAGRDTWRGMRETLARGIAVTRRSRVIVSLFVATVFLGAFSETFDRLWEAHLLAGFEFPTFVDWSPVVWFGLIDAVALVLTVAATGVARRRVDAGSISSVPPILIATVAALMVAVVGLGLAQQFALAVGLYQAAVVLRIVHAPLLTAWLNEQLESGSRATVLSMHSQSDAAGQVVGGPTLGALATAASLSVAFVVAGFLLMPAVWLYASAWRRSAPEKFR